MSAISNRRIPKAVLPLRNAHESTDCDTGANCRLSGYAIERLPDRQRSRPPCPRLAASPTFRERSPSFCTPRARRAAVHAAVLVYRPLEAEPAGRRILCRTCRSTSARIVIATRCWPAICPARRRRSISSIARCCTAAQRSTPRMSTSTSASSCSRERHSSVVSACAGARPSFIATTGTLRLLHCSSRRTTPGISSSPTPSPSSPSTTLDIRARSAHRRLSDLGLGDKSYLLHQDDLRAGFVNPLKHGIMYADAITTVSPTHAKEIQTDEYGMGLQGYLRDARQCRHWYSQRCRL